MANPEHLAILGKGLKAWKEWRLENRETEPDLSGANLSGADLREAELGLADLSGAKLTKADLWGARLGGANLSGADLRGAGLSTAWLLEANLIKADLFEAFLNLADLTLANLSEADLREAELDRADLSGAKLIGANLSKAKLFEANLSNANLTGANLSEADLRRSQLIRSRLTKTELSGARLYGTARDDWDIKGVECKYVYWDAQGDQRSPKDRNLEPQEFERLYATLPTIEYVFENGMSPMDPLIMDRVVQAIGEQNPEFDIKIESISARGLAPSIKFTVQQEEHKEPALAEIRRRYEEKLKELEQVKSERDRLYALVSRAIEAPREQRLITAAPGSIVAMDGSTVNVEQHIHNAVELQTAIAEQPEDSETFAKVAKRKALDVVGGAIQDFAKGQVKEAAKRIVELGKDLGPAILNAAAYTFFKNLGG